MNKTLATAFLATLVISACGGGNSVRQDTNSDSLDNSLALGVPKDCAVDPSAVSSNPNAFQYEDVAGKDFFWVGDDDESGLNPVRLKMGVDCVLRARPGYENFGDSPTVVAQWQYTTDGAIRIVDWADQFSLIQTTSVAHEICWGSFSTCEGEGRFRSEGGVRRLFFAESDARAYFDSL